MDEPQRPAELSEEAWQATAPEARQFIALLVAKLAALEARLNQNWQNSSKPPSSDPPSAPPRPAKTPRGKPKSKGAQPGHPDQQRELVPTENVTRVVELHPTGCPSCQPPFPELLPTLGPPRRQQVWDLPVIVPEITVSSLVISCPPIPAKVSQSRTGQQPRVGT
jgi:transposase